MCGIIALRSPTTDETLEVLLFGLDYLHRRGPEGMGAGFINPITRTLVNFKAITDKEKEQFRDTVKRMAHDIQATMAQGQTRYITDQRPKDTGLRHANTQPLHQGYNGKHNLPQESIFTHNRQLQRKEELAAKVMFPVDSIADVDSRPIAEYMMQMRRLVNDPWVATQWVMQALLEIDGAASFTYSDGENLIAGRDPQGYRPLAFGRIKGSWVVVSETGFFNEARGEFGETNVSLEGLLAPAEMLLIPANGNPERRILLNTTIIPERPCEFEDVYFKDEISLDNAGRNSARSRREKEGVLIAQRYRDRLTLADFISPSPNSGICYAQGMAREDGTPPYKSAFRKPLVGRKRRNFLSNKSDKAHPFVVDTSSVEDMHIAVTDDSLMRGHTTAHLYMTLKEAGAKAIDFYIAWPPTIFDCYYGTDFKSEELLAYRLLEKGVITRNDDGSVHYDIDEVNQATSELVREIVKEEYKEKYGREYNGEYGDLSDLNIFYGTREMIKQCQSTRTACKRCIEGR